MISAACPDDLLARSRRDALADGEREALQAHLSACPACQMVATLGEDFDRVGATRPRDERLVARITHRATQASLTSAPRRFGPSNGQILSLVAAVAVGVGGGVWLATSFVVDSPRVIVPPPTVVGAGAPMHAPAPPALEPVPTPAASTPLASIEHAAHHPHDAPPSASALFARANETRREDSGEESIALYRQLQRLYPRSPEAKVSHLSLANLLLGDAQRAEQALPQFDAYLAGGGALEEEALYGRAQVLEKLARHYAERSAWRRLLNRFPDSVYASKARHRLETLP
jgi:hypothetical protein